MEIWIPKLLGTDTKNDQIRVKGYYGCQRDFNNVRKQAVPTVKVSDNRRVHRHF